MGIVASSQHPNFERAASRRGEADLQQAAEGVGLGEAALVPAAEQQARICRLSKAKGET